MIYSSKEVHTEEPPIISYSFQSIIKVEELDPETNESKMVPQYTDKITYFGKYKDLHYWGVPDDLILSMESQPEQAEVTAVPEPDAELYEWLVAQSPYAKYVQSVTYHENIGSQSRTENEEKVALYQQIQDIATALAPFLEAMPMSADDEGTPVNPAINTIFRLKAQSDNVKQKFKDVGL